MITLKNAQETIERICDALTIRAEKNDSESLLDIVIDLNDRASIASDAKELLLAIEIADAELEQLGGLDESIEALRNVAKEIAA